MPQRVDTQQLDLLIFGGHATPRFTQDSPVAPEVWAAYNEAGDERVDLLLTPHQDATAGGLAAELRRRLDHRGKGGRDAHLSYTSSYVVARLTLRELLWAALPMTPWWWHLAGQPEAEPSQQILTALRRFDDDPLALLPRPDDPATTFGELPWLVRLAAALLTDGAIERPLAKIVGEALDPVHKLEDRPPVLWSVTANRPVRAAIYDSRRTVKADAAQRVFEVDTSGLAWAVIDGGIDATHPAFRRRDADGVPLESPYGDGSTVIATLDFTKLRALRAGARDADDRAAFDAFDDLDTALQQGKTVDWVALERLITIPHTDEHAYKAPTHPHGTHVAGILAGDWRSDDKPAPPDQELRGVAPGLALFDLRVLDDQGNGDEFALLAALSWIRARNGRGDRQRIHGVNLSLSLDHAVRNYACGRTPACDECSRLIGAGVVAVAAAGNAGTTTYAYQGVASDGFRAISITDPGNAEAVITVGATHRLEPHAYGVSWFSSRGPTGDGRAKPDLVAPGEKITGPVPGGQADELDGTSMAAPHVSGVAALLLGRYRELIGQPQEVKRILCESATDLQRERSFQGAGLIDTLRALQAV
ncbi:S8 family serine peptidase [Baekduia sp.]|jgi:subtilisin family serine protease|uniref:S8 family serine peptidase n=1 Tax=Baekduia sp. TaxID=2600305 RepID=UPI002E03B346|nr:S8 family serine peptidase [Baekduia sp.]